MRRFQTVYLAGPDRMAPDAEAILERKRAMTRDADFSPVLAEAGAGEGEPDELRARILYADTVAKLRACDAVIANLTPWRGPDPDASTVFEAGLAAGLGKPLFAYMNVPDAEEADHRSRVEAYIEIAADEAGVWRDGDGALVEDLGLPVTPMLWSEVRGFYVVVTPEPLSDVTGLELCLEALRLYAD